MFNDTVETWINSSPYKIMKEPTKVILFLFLLGISCTVFGDGNQKVDSRINLNFTKSEKNEFLSEMREMLASIQGIVTGIGTSDRGLIIRSARYSGNRMARNTPQAIREKLPQSFKDLGGPTHMMFEELVIRAETDDMDMLAEFTGRLMHQCLSCHAMFKVD